MLATEDANQEIIQEYDSKLNKIILELRNKNTDGLDYIQFLYDYLELIHNNLKKPLKEYCDCQETIKEILYTTTEKFVIEK